MSDDLHIPAAGRGSAPIRTYYQPRRPGMDRGTKALLAAGAGLGGLLLAGVGGWALSGRHAAVVPVIEADSRPVRVKPENPGGLQVAGADEQVMGGQGSKTRGLAPPPEVPAAQALRAQMPPQAAVPPPAPALPVLPAAPPPAVVLQPPVAPAPAATPQAPAPAPASTLVQLAAVDSAGAAQTEWQRLAKRMPDLLGDRQPVVQKAERDGRAVWRLRTGGFLDIADATAFCARVRAKGGACSITGS